MPNNPFITGFENPGQAYAETGLGGGTAGNSRSFREAVAAREADTFAEKRMEEIRLAKEKREGPIEGGGVAAGYGFLKNNGTVLNSGTNTNDVESSIPDPQAQNNNINPSLFSGNQAPNEMFADLNPTVASPQRLEDSIMNPLTKNI